MAQFMAIVAAIAAIVISHLLGTSFFVSLGLGIAFAVIGLGLVIWLLGRMGKHLPNDPDAPTTGGSHIEAPNPRRRETTQPTFRENVRNARVIIDYTDANKEQTQRTINVQAFDFYVNRDGVTIITDLHAYCELRRDVRQFKYRRIGEASDAETGETIPNLGTWLWAHRA
ncbi:hypothetical protein [Komagataeibacter europaeus]|uniref:hypothetical protein n=1 Tax=Komagataeibacter europaeus TaxID=33995 RepID=UPI0003765CE8|nr:hypothetical protein [Komagataeibacter europaeus]